MVTPLISGWVAYWHKLSCAKISMPALQKADTEWKMEIQIPRNPNCGTNTGIHNKAPTPSTAKVPVSTRLTKRINPDNELRLKASCSNSRSPSPIRRCNITIIPAKTVITPKPPIWISRRITACPNPLHVVTVGRVTSPVTQVDVVAVNRASIYATASPLAEAIGRASNPLPISMAARKLSNMICVVDNFFCFISLL